MFAAFHNHSTQLTMLQVNSLVTQRLKHFLFQTLFLDWDSFVLDWDAWFFTRWVPGLTIAICNKITYSVSSQRRTLSFLYCIFRCVNQAPVPAPKSIGLIVCLQTCKVCTFSATACHLNKYNCVALAVNSCLDGKLIVEKYSLWSLKFRSQSGKFNIFSRFKWEDPSSELSWPGVWR